MEFFRLPHVAVGDTDKNPYSTDVSDFGKRGSRINGPLDLYRIAVGEEGFADRLSVRVGLLTRRLHICVRSGRRWNFIAYDHVHGSTDVKSWFDPRVLDWDVHRDAELRFVLHRIAGIEDELRIFESDFPATYPRTMLGLPFGLLSIQRAPSQDGQGYGGSNANSFQPSSIEITPVSSGALSVFGFVVFCYFHEKLHTCFRSSPAFFLLFALLGLLIFAYGSCKFIESILNIGEQPSGRGCEFFHDGDTVTYALLTAGYCTLRTMRVRSSAGCWPPEKASTSSRILSAMPSAERC